MKNFIYLLISYLLLVGKSSWDDSNNDSMKFVLQISIAVTTSGVILLTYVLVGQRLKMGGGQQLDSKEGKNKYPFLLYS